MNSGAGKERPLNRDEAIEQAKLELAPFWIHSDPLLAGIRTTPDQVSVFPLDPAFLEKPWLVFFVDPTDFDGQSALSYIREWTRRYQVVGVRTLLVNCQTGYAFLRDTAIAEKFLKRHHLTIPVCLDQGALLRQAMGVSKLPFLVLLHHGKNALSAPLDLEVSAMEKLETDLQRYLRVSDPGLALLPPFIPDEVMLKDISRLEFGVSNPVTAVAALRAGEYFLRGTWVRENGRLIAKDASSVMEVVSPSGHFSIVAEPAIMGGRSARVYVETTGGSCQSFAGSDLSTDDDGHSVVRISHADLFHVARGLPPTHRRLTLKFAAAQDAPVALYGLRFSG